jgi:hypothetical protein
MLASACKACVALASLTGFVDGFVTFSETTDAMNDLKVEVFDRELTWGFYRWPTAWPISWTGSHGPVRWPLSN